MQEKLITKYDSARHVDKCKHKCIYEDRSLTCLHDITHNLDACDEDRISFCASHECKILFELDTYKNALEDSKDKELKLIAINNTFRTLMLGGDSMESLVKDGVVDLSVYHRQFIRRNEAGWEACSIETLLVFMQVFQKMAEYFSQKVGTKISKVEIKRELIKRTQKETVKSNQQVLKEQTAKIEDAFFKTNYGKAVAGAMKTFKITREAAESMVQSMGVKK